MRGFLLLQIEMQITPNRVMNMPTTCPLVMYSLKTNTEYNIGTRIPTLLAKFSVYTGKNLYDMELHIVPKKTRHPIEAKAF
jgi:hypothetical protein